MKDLFTERIEVSDNGKELICKDADSRLLWRVQCPTLQEWHENHNYGGGRYTKQNLEDGVFLGVLVKDGKAIATFVLRSQLMVNITYDIASGTLIGIHEAR